MQIDPEKQALRDLIEQGYADSGLDENYNLTAILTEKGKEKARETIQNTIEGKLEIYKVGLELTDDMDEFILFMQAVCNDCGVNVMEALYDKELLGIYGDSHNDIEAFVRMFEPNEKN